MIRIIKSRDLLTELAWKIHFEADSDFYKIFGKSRRRIYADLCDMMLDERTEEYNANSVILDDTVVGVMSFYDSDEIYYRQLFSLDYLRKQSDAKAEAISNFSKEVPPIDLKSLYLSRITISKRHQGRGYATQLLAFLEQEAARNGFETITLHVRSDNAQAISVYERYGFSIHNGNWDYVIMSKRVA